MTDARRGRPRSESAHRAVLTATARLLDTVPYGEVTVEAIAAEAGVGKQTIYRWWPHKAAVVLEAMLAGYVDLTLAPLPDTGDLRADLTVWMDAMVEEAFADAAVSMARSLLSALLQGGTTTDELLRTSAIWDEGALTDRLRTEMAAGSIRDDVDPRAVSAALVDPLVIRMITTGRPSTQWAHSLVATVVAGLAPTRD